MGLEVDSVSWWGPACHYPLTLPNLQAGACSSGNGWCVSVLCFGRFEYKSDGVCLWGSLGAYQAGIPLLGSPDIPLWAPSLFWQPHILFEWGGGLGGCGCASSIWKTGSLNQEKTKTELNWTTIRKLRGSWYDQIVFVNSKQSDTCWSWNIIENNHIARISSIYHTSQALQ